MHHDHTRNLQLTFLPVSFFFSFIVLQFHNHARIHRREASKRALCTSGDYVCSLEHQHFVILWCKLHVMYEVESSLLIMLFEILRIF